MRDFAVMLKILQRFFVGIFEIGDVYFLTVDGEGGFVRDRTEEMGIVREEEFEILFILRIYGHDDAARGFRKQELILRSGSTRHIIIINASHR